MPKLKNSSKNVRELWLQRAARSLTKTWAKLGVAVPADIRVSCSFPGGGSPTKRIGECWPRVRSIAKVNEIFINPTLDDTSYVLDVLGHELLHAVDDCKSKHGRVFSKNSRMVGYSGGRRSHAETKAAQELLARLAKTLGAYPHSEVLIHKKQQKENTGLHKFECAIRGDTDEPVEGEKYDVLYSTAKMVELFGIPSCRCHGEQMLPVDRQEKKVLTTV